jgi:N-acetylglucosaminyldiphosphoundecaprenol N-acetyl-beta-D-mannosaminyltransferase
MLSSLPTGQILGTPVHVVTYEMAYQAILAALPESKPIAIAAANTHLIGEAHSNPEFAQVLRSFDLVMPDGMPLVWALWLEGHDIQDRVYGPYFMEYALTHSAPYLRHYFFGGTESCLAQLQMKARELNPHLQIVGVVSPPFGAWDAATESRLIDDINASKADFIWVALGGVKQETWIAKNRHRFHQGAFLAVGDAFTLVAGLRAYAPAWIQRLGLTWLVRLLQEPRRLFSRYLSYNTRFASAYLLDRFKLVYRDSEPRR